MDFATTDSNGFIITRDSEGLDHSAVPWDDPYPFFKGMIPKHETESVRMTVRSPMSAQVFKLYVYNCITTGFALVWIFIILNYTEVLG